ncbi:MAG: Asp-tRNA(Asn)/Glu-tRNA(Gln) amidotransferase subunit GatB [Patescibacteria group bacterium]|nr:Asp-tRNA(Asn)/Glu-tRNA(Gln) amidotransferase subunit GatB [Patescibacteria group bacterium]MDE1946118.1 Asp-tRNA(Asn)/Glu-tRNA(Gln) amidotransferase subunit GatB [Patescibacteria group bacterium]
MTETKYTATIGLEIHAELKVATKMFCNCKNDPDEKRPNVNVCPVCTAQPGTLPVLNKKAIEHVIRVGLASGSDIAGFTEWDRKNYFYPDIPKGYQISQYKYPLVANGAINGVKLTRIHLEEDTARSTHDKGDFSLVDFNRGGVALMELVTEPVIHDAKTAGNFARELQLLLQYLGAGDANMEKGEMRVEANVSVSKDPKKFGTKVEVKNLNSFRTVEKAIEYEIERHIETIEVGGKIVQETRGWDEAKQKTFSQRLKESSHDYRYFPDPDIPKMMVPEVFDLKKLKADLPELPWQRREKYLKFGVKAEDAESYVGDRTLGDFFEKVSADFAGDAELVKTASNYVSSDLVGLLSKDKNLKYPDHKYFAEIIKMFKAGDLSSRGAKDLIARILKDNVDPRKIAEKEGLIQKSDEGELKTIIEKLVKENPKVVADYRGGKQASLQFFVGQVMKITKGSANPQAIMKVILEVLK